jgi:PST family polysaccharide transporter
VSRKLPAAKALRALRHPISQNAFALYVVQFAISILPLVTLPYLARVLGPHELGLVVFSQSFTWMLQLVIEFGFGASATRSVAGRRDDREALTEAVAAVQGAKLLLCLASAAAAIVGFFAVPVFQDHPGYLALALVAALAQGLEPLWYFTGIERLRLVSGISVANRVLATVLTIVLVRDEGDGWIVLALWAAGAVVVTSTATVLLYRGLPLRRPSWSGVRWALSESWRLFIGSAAITLYTSANAFLLGVLSSTLQAAYFSAAEKLVRAAPRVISPITTAVYPRVGNLVARGEEERARRLTRLTLIAMAGLATAVSLMLFVLAEPIITLLYGEAFAPSITVLRILALMLPMLTLSSGLANLVLLTRHMDRDVVVIVVVAGLVNLALALLLAPRYGAEGMAWALLAVETLALAGTLVAVTAHRRRRYAALQ